MEEEIQRVDARHLDQRSDQQEDRQELQGRANIHPAREPVRKQQWRECRRREIGHKDAAGEGRRLWPDPSQAAKTKGANHVDASAEEKKVAVLPKVKGKNPMTGM